MVLDEVDLFNAPGAGAAEQMLRCELQRSAGPQLALRAALLQMVGQLVMGQVTEEPQGKEGKEGRKIT